MRRRILIVVSSYEPAMPANMQRTRMLAWCLEDLGWQVEILTPGAEFQQTAWTEPYSSSFFAPAVLRHEARPTFDLFFRLMGMRSAGWRGLFAVYLAGARLLKHGRFDLVYCSTTAFNFFCLCRLWKVKCGIPYLLDFQDPWYRPRARFFTTRHRVKAWLGNKLSKYLESFAVHGARGLVSVSPNYLDDLRSRHPHAEVFLSGLHAVIPFGALPRDLLVATAEVAQDSKAIVGVRIIAYVGVGDIVMQRSFRRLVSGLARLRERWPDVVGRCRISLAGTQGGWEDGKPKVLWNEACAAGVGDLVNEDPAIVSYSTATAIASAADGLLILGVDDPAYMPSKLFPYAFTGKPLLACMHWDSQVNEYFKQFPDLGSLMHFAGPPEVEASEDSRLLGYLNQVWLRQTFDRAAIKVAYSADAMARRHAQLFNACLLGEK